MSGQLIFTGVLAGRFYRMETPPDPGDSLLENAREHAWRDGDGPGVRSVRRFCTGCLPNNGRLDEDTEELSYVDNDGGVWRMWWREEDRRAPKKATERLARQMALEESSDLVLENLERHEREEWMGRATAELLMQAIPIIRVVPIVVLGDLIWVARRSVFGDVAARGLLSKVVGAVREDPMVWDTTEGSPGWFSYSTATLQAYVEGDGSSQLEPDVTLTEVEIRGHSLRCRSSNDAAEVRQALGALMKSTRAEVGRLSFTVNRDGEDVSMDIDKYGVYKICPARSSGGLVTERLRRRFEDGAFAMERVRETMHALWSARSE